MKNKIFMILLVIAIILEIVAIICAIIISKKNNQSINKDERTIGAIDFAKYLIDWSHKKILWADDICDACVEYCRRQKNEPD